MRDFLILFVHLIGIVVRLAKPGGFRSVVAESVLVRHQLLILNRGRKRAPKLRAADRIITGLCTLFIRPARLVGSAIVLKRSTLLYFHNLLRKRKYRMLFSSKAWTSAWPKGAGERTHRRRCRNETAESHLGLSPHCPADRLSCSAS